MSDVNLHDLSFHRQGGWRNQFERMQRWHARVKRLGAGVSAEEQDMLYAFFQNCFALKDWLKNSGAANANELNAFVESRFELKLCRDIANGTKHFELNDASVDPQFFICREYVPPNSIMSRSPGQNSVVLPSELDSQGLRI